MIKKSSTPPIGRKCCSFLCEGVLVLRLGGKTVGFPALVDQQRGDTETAAGKTALKLTPFSQNGGYGLI